jgi:hypothetical protein
MKTPPPSKFESRISRYCLVLDGRDTSFGTSTLFGTHASNRFHYENTVRYLGNGSPSLRKHWPRSGTHFTLALFGIRAKSRKKIDVFLFGAFFCAVSEFQYITQGMFTLVDSYICGYWCGSKLSTKLTVLSYRKEFFYIGNSLRMQTFWEICS